MRLINTIMASFVYLFFLAGCAPESSSLFPISEKVSSEPAVTAKGGWQAKWENLLKEAAKEGVMFLYSTAGGEMREALTRPLKDKFSLNVQFISGKGAEISQKLFAERRAGLYLADVYLGGSTTIVTSIKPSGALDPIEPELFLPQVLDSKVWYEGKLRFIDKDKLLLSFIAFANNPITINTTMVRPEEIKSYKDLLHSKWKSKIILDYPATAGLGQKFVHIVGGYILGYDYIKELAKQEPVILVDKRQQVDWVARGRYPIAIVPKTEIVTEFKKAGASLFDITPIEGSWTTAGSGNMALINRAAHPNAARVFINWLLTQEGQSIFSKTYGAPSRRLDVTTEGLDPGMIIRPEVKYIVGDSEEILLETPETIDIARKILGHLMP